jgi:hypothetical protein
MKKLFLAALAGTAMLGLSACGGNDADDTATSTDTTMATTDTYAVPADTTSLDETTSGATDTTTSLDTTTSAEAPPAMDASSAAQ